MSIVAVSKDPDSSSQRRERFLREKKKDVQPSLIGSSRTGSCWEPTNFMTQSAASSCSKFESAHQRFVTLSTTSTAGLPMAQQKQYSTSEPDPVQERSSTLRSTIFPMLTPPPSILKPPQSRRYHSNPPPTNGDANLSTISFSQRLQIYEQNHIRQYNQQVQSAGMSLPKYKDMIEHSSPNSIHLPAQHEFTHNHIHESSPHHYAQNPFATPSNGFTSFNEIKTKNQELLLNLHTPSTTQADFADYFLPKKHHSHNKVKSCSDQSNSKLSSIQSSHITLPSKNYKRMEIELEHNKALMKTVQTDVDIRSAQSYQEAHHIINQFTQVLQKMPQIRKYPIQHRQHLQKSSDPLTSEELPAPIEVEESNLKQEKPKRNSGDQISTIRIFGYNIPQNSWKPCAREGATFIVEKNKAYLFGGLGSSIFNSIESLDLENELRWTSVSPSSGLLSLPQPRFGHSMSLLKGSLIIFGGEKSFNSNLKQQSCFADIHSFHIESGKWTQINASGEWPCARRNHTASVYGRWLIIHGGSNVRDKVLSDTWAFDTGTQVWQEISDSVSESLQPIQKYPMASHSCCSVFYPQRIPKLALFRPSDMKIPKWIPQIIQEGIYFFGGKNEEGEIEGELRVLKIDSYPMQWVIPQTSGKPPTPRCSHSMDFHPQQNMVIISGGKNDSLQGANVFMHETVILNVETLCWIQVEFSGQASIPRANHCSVIFDSKIILFGGLNHAGFVNSSVQILELDQANIRQMIKIESQKKREHEIQNEFLVKNILTVPSLAQNGNGDQPMFGTSLFKHRHSAFQQIYKEIPFTNRRIVRQSFITKPDVLPQKSLVEKLSYNNFTSFLPIPLKTSTIPTKPVDAKQSMLPSSSKSTPSSMSKSTSQLRPIPLEAVKATDHPEPTATHSPGKEGQSSPTSDRFKKAFSKLKAMSTIQHQSKHA